MKENKFLRIEQHEPVEYDDYAEDSAEFIDREAELFHSSKKTNKDILYVAG